MLENAIGATTLAGNSSQGVLNLMPVTLDVWTTEAHIFTQDLKRS